MSIKVYKENYTVTADPTSHDKGEIDEQFHVNAVDTQFGFEGDVCWIRDTEAKYRDRKFIFHDYWWNMADANGVAIGTKEEVNAYLKGFIGSSDGVDSTPVQLYKINTLLTNSEQIQVDVDLDADFDISVKYPSWTGGGSSTYLFGNAYSQTNNNGSGMLVGAWFSTQIKFEFPKSDAEGGTWSSQVTTSKPTTIRWTKVGNVISCYENGNLVLSETNPDWDGSYPSTGQGIFIGSYGNALYSTCSCEEIIINGEILRFRNGSGSIQKSDRGTYQAQIMSTASADDMWEAI